MLVKLKTPAHKEARMQKKEKMKAVRLEENVEVEKPLLLPHGPRDVAAVGVREKVMRIKGNNELF